MPAKELPCAAAAPPCERIAYSAARDRVPLRWPGGARVALWMAPNIEHYEYLPEKMRVHDPWPRMSHGQYNTRYHWNLTEDDGHAAIAQKICGEFDSLHAEGATHGKVMSIAVHPFIMGPPLRIGHLSRALKYVLSHGGVWCATGSEIIDWYSRHALAEQMAELAASRPG